MKSKPILKSSSTLRSVKIVEMALRDGLQNESVNLPVAVRVELAKRLAAAGVKRMEIGAFVRPDWIPQMAHSAKVINKLYQMQGRGEISNKVKFSALVPNIKGLELAAQTPIQEIAVFAAASESFSNKNINCSISESLKRFEPVLRSAKSLGLPVRGYLSTCFGCPYEGAVSEARVVKIAKQLFDMGCFEISIGDTIGVAHPGQVQSLFSKLLQVIPAENLAGHFHDTRGTALVNIFAAYQMGIGVFDSSLGGLGGCPYAPGASGNVATEDVIYLFDGLKVKTGIDLSQMISLSHWLSKKMHKELPSQVSKAGLLKPLQ